MLPPRACCTFVLLTLLAEGLSYTTHLATSCYRGNFKLSCDRGHRIHIESDQYGYSTGNKCAYTEGDCVIDNKGHRSLTTRYCEAHLTCSTGISVSKRLCGMKFTNYQIIKYNCVPETDVVRLCQANSFEGTEGFVATPRFPFSYPDDVDCRCSLSTAHPGGVKVKFHSFDVTNNPTGPCNDFVELTYNGKSVKTCTEPKLIMLSGKTTIRFVSSSVDRSAQGFWMKFSVPPEHKVKVVCGAHMRGGTVQQPPEVTSMQSPKVTTAKEMVEMPTTTEPTTTPETPETTIPEVTTVENVTPEESTTPEPEPTTPEPEPTTQRAIEPAKKHGAMPTTESSVAEDTPPFQTITPKVVEKQKYTTVVVIDTTKASKVLSKEMPSSSGSSGSRDSGGATTWYQGVSVGPWSGSTGTNTNVNKKTNTQHTTGQLKPQISQSQDGNTKTPTESAGEKKWNQNTAHWDIRYNITVVTFGGSSGEQNKSTEKRPPLDMLQQVTNGTRDHSRRDATTESLDMLQQVTNSTRDHSRRDATTESLENGIIEVEQFDNFTNSHGNESDSTTTAAHVNGSDSTKDNASTEKPTTTKMFETSEATTVADESTTVTVRTKKVIGQERVGSSDGMMKRPPISLFKAPQAKVAKLSEKENDDDSANHGNKEPAGFNFLTVVMCAVAGVLGIVMFIVGFVTLNKRKKYFRFGNLFGSELASIISNTLERRARETKTEASDDSTSIHSTDTEISHDLSASSPDAKTARVEEISEENPPVLKTMSLGRDFKIPVDMRNLAVLHGSPVPNPVIDRRPPALPPRLYTPKQVMFPDEETEVPPPLPVKKAGGNHEYDRIDMPAIPLPK